METRTDIELITAFAACGADALKRVQGEAAFAELVSRHQQMVFRTCLRMLNDTHDAQDATQATFIVLMKKADRLKREGALGGWLHAVARRVSLEAIQRRASEAKRREAAAAVAESNDGDATVDTEAVLRCVDEELEGLSALQRQAVVLRYLEGHGERDAAQLADCPVGTLTRRASDGIARLRSRLAKRGIAIGLPALAATLASEAQAAIPETLLPSTLTAAKAYAAGAAATGVSTSAAVLAKGAMNMMFWSSVKTAAVMTAAAMVVAGTGVVVAQKAIEPATPTVASEQPEMLDLQNKGQEGEFTLRVVRDGMGQVAPHTAILPVRVTAVEQIPDGAADAPKVGDKIGIYVSDTIENRKLFEANSRVILTRKRISFPKHPTLDHWQYRLAGDSAGTQDGSAELKKRLQSIVIPGWRITEEPLAKAVALLADAISANDPQHARVTIELNPTPPSLRLQAFTLLTMDSRETAFTAMQTLETMAQMSGQKIVFEKERVVLTPLQPDKTTVVIPEISFKDAPVAEVVKTLQAQTGVPIRLQRTGDLPSITLSAKNIQLDNAVFSAAAQAGLVMGYEKDGLFLK